MNALRPAEWASLSGTFPDAAITELPGGSSLISIPSLRLPAGWSSVEAPVWFAVPVGYPAAQPDCFWSGPALRLTSGAMPANTGIQHHPVTQEAVLWFSWHLASWRPSDDDVSTFARFIVRRFADAR